MLCPAETCSKAKSLPHTTEHLNEPREAHTWIPTAQHHLAFLLCLQADSSASLWPKIPVLTVFVTRLAHRQKDPNVAPGLALPTHSSLTPDGQPSPHRSWFLCTPCSSGSTRVSTLHAGSKAGQDTCLTLVPHVTHQCYALGWDLRYSWSRNDK